jgi:signal peptidase I
MKGYLRELLITVGLALVIYLLFQTVIQSSEVFDISMQPTLIAGDRLIVVKPIYNFSDPERGDIIVLRPPMSPGKQYVKRLIGLPGDVIEVKNNQLHINGVPLDEPYLKEPPRYTMKSVTLPADHYFVLGDNRNSSSDSHSGWTITRQEIVGKACLRIWPFNKFGGPGNYPLGKQVIDAHPAVVSGSLPVAIPDLWHLP